ncbi:MAG: hypothetical protein ABI969_15400 [bacterium]
MLITLLALGVALIAFGAVVLLRYPDRPGGTLKGFGAEVTSKGAGLPLIALGVGCIGYAAVHFQQQNLLQSAKNTTIDTGATGGTSSVTRQVNDTSCLSTLLSGIPRDRIDSVEVGVRDLEIIGSHQKLDSAFALVLTENGKRIGALRLRLYPAKTSSSHLYKIEQAVDASCANVEQMRNTSVGGNPRELMNWNTMRATLGAHEYDLRIGGEGSINVSHFTRVP